MQYFINALLRNNNETCPKGFGLKLAKLGLKIPLRNKVKQKPSLPNNNMFPTNI